MFFENILEIDLSNINKTNEIKTMPLEEGIENKFGNIFQDVEMEINNDIEDIKENIDCTIDKTLENTTDETIDIIQNTNINTSNDIKDNKEDLLDSDDIDKNIKIGTKKINSVQCYLNDSDNTIFNNELANKEPEEIEIKSTECDSRLNLSELNINKDYHSNTKEHNEEQLEVHEVTFNQDCLHSEESINISQDVSPTNKEQVETERKILKQIKESINSNSTSRSIQVMLKPNSLGKVNMNLKFFNNTLHINMFVENSLTEEILKQNISQIVEMIDPSSLIKIGKVNIKKFSDLYDNQRLEEDTEIEPLSRRSLIQKPQYIKGIYRL